EDEHTDRDHTSAIVAEARAHFSQIRTWCDRVHVRGGGNSGWDLYHGNHHRRLLLLFALQRFDQGAFPHPGSINSCSTSTSRFMSTKVTATTSTPACSTWKSRATIAWKINCPRPGHEKIVSTSTEPPSRKPTCRPATVSTGDAADLATCRNTCQLRSP